jgi:hypothetical protein
MSDFRSRKQSASNRFAADPMPSRRTGRLKRFGGDFCKKKIFGPNPFAAPHRLSEQTHQKDDADETNPDTL